MYNCPQPIVSLVTSLSGPPVLAGFILQKSTNPLLWISTAQLSVKKDAAMLVKELCRGFLVFPKSLFSLILL